MLKFTEMYLEFVRPQAIMVSNSNPELKGFIWSYVAKIDGAIYHKDTRKACTYAMQWQEDMKNNSSFASRSGSCVSLNRLKTFVDNLVNAPF